MDAWQMRCCQLDRLLPGGLVRDQHQVDPVAIHFRDQQIDALEEDCKDILGLTPGSWE